MEINKAHARRKFCELADIVGNLHHNKSSHQISPIAYEAVKRIDAIFDIERGINGLTPKASHEARSRLSALLITDLEAWLRAERTQMSRHNPVAKAINYLFEKDHWSAFTRLLTDGNVCPMNNAAERACAAQPLAAKPGSPMSAQECRPCRYPGCRTRPHGTCAAQLQSKKAA